MKQTNRDYNARSLGGWSNWRETMANMARDRQERNETILCHEFSFSPIPMGEAIIVGTFSCTWMKAKKRYIKRQYVRDIGYGPQTPSEICRDYLISKFGRATPARTKTTPALSGFLPMPAFAKPGKYKGDYAYFDVKGAYRAIMRVAGWPCAYNPGLYLGRGGTVADCPLSDEDKAKNYLVSCGLPGKLYILTPWGPTMKKSYNPLLNGHLWRLVSDTLHCLACFAHDECEAVYFLTDGAIIPIKYEEKYKTFASRLGLTLDLKSGIGPTWIKAVGCHKLPGKTTKNFTRYHPHSVFKLRYIEQSLVDRLERLRDMPEWPPEDEYPTSEVGNMVANVGNS